MAPGSLRRVGILAWTEATRTRGSFDRRTTLALLAIGLVTALLMPALLERGMDFDRDLYRVAIHPDSPLLPAVEGSRLFQRIVTPDPLGVLATGDADIAILPDVVRGTDSPKSAAALAALRQAAKDWSFSNLAREADGAAAFPVRVELVYVAQARAPGAAAPSIPASALPTPERAKTEGSVSGGGAGAGSPSEALPSSAEGGFDFLPQERSVNTPETLSPPFPFRSLLLAYAFLIPMNFIVQVYAGSAIAERIERKGEPLLASPARPWEIIFGKALPYLAGMMAMSAAIVLLIGGGWLSLLAVVPLALAFLSLEFLAAMYARSFRELTFLTVFTSVLLTIYAFLPAVFTDVHPISLVSPITLVVMDLRGDAVPLGQILYAIAPLTLFSGVIYVLGAALYREEDLFHQKRVGSKALDSLARQVRSMRSAIRIQVLLIPLVFVAELMLITFLFAWPVPVGLVGILLAVALVEELFKAAPTVAGVKRGLVAPRRALAFGALAGLGFFLAEKGFLLASLAGLMDVPAAAAVFGASAGLVDGAGAALLLLVAPLALHVATAALSGWGAGQGRRAFALAFVASVAIHTTYNLAIVRLLGAGVGV